MAKKKEPREETALPNGPGPDESAPSEAGPAAVSSPSKAAGGAAGAEPGPAEPAERLPALEAEVADLQDRLLRKQADFENFRKRMLREREDGARYANAALLADLLAVIDDFERAIRSAEDRVAAGGTGAATPKDFALFLQGVGMIERRMLEMLESRWGLKRFSAVGEVFDPVRHEAMQRSVAPSGAQTVPTVIEEYQKGYYLHDRVLRPAKVKVLVPAEPVGPAGGGAGDGGSPGGAAGPSDAA
jgi:molecular chaperone GrpE